MRTAFAILISCTLALSGCKKDDVNIAELTYNAFDADYAGPPIFELDHTYTDMVVYNGVSYPRFNGVIKVRRDRFAHSSGYVMRYRLLPSAGWAVLPSTQVPDDEVTVRIENYSSGTEYCWVFELGTTYAYGASDTICATAP